MIFVRKHYLGIDLGESEVKAVLLRKKTRGWRVESVFRFPVATEDAESRAASWQEALRRVARSTQLRAPLTTLGMPSQQSTLKVIELPATDRRSLEQMLRYEAHQHIPFRADNAEIDFALLGGRTTAVRRPTEDTQRVALAACDKGALNTYRSALRTGGLRPRVVDVGLLGAANCFSSRPAALEVPEPDGVLTADIGRERTLAVVLQHGAFHSYRVVPFGGRALTEALAQDFEVSPEEAEGLKHRHGVAPPADYAAGASDTPNTTQWVDRLAAELQVTIQAYRAGARLGQVNRILLTGGGALAEGLPEALSRRLRLEVFAPAPWAGFEVGSGVSSEDAALFACATGLALRGDRALVDVNLAAQLSREARAARQVRARGIAAGAVAGIAVIALGAHFQGRLQTRRDELVTLGREVLKYPPVETKARSSDQTQVKEMAHRAAESRRNGRLWLELLLRLSADLPEGVWFDEAHFDANGTVSIRGSAKTSAQATNALSAIHHIPEFRDARLTYANTVERDKVQLTQFQIVCTVATEGGVAS
jgi:type IV pilus assembly protein PilM